MTRRYYDEYFPRSVPRRAKGGIKARSKRGAFGENWWAKRWNAVLESFNIGARLGRGRSYARRGQVLSIDVQPGVVIAEVQGSRRTPYSVLIEVETLSKAQWKKLAGTLGKQAIFAAKLMAGEMPPDIEDAFHAAGLSLFPERRVDLATECSCPDWSNPCKHIAAVYYLLGEEFDRDPFLIFKLRGIDRKELVGLVADRAGAGRRSTRTKADTETYAKPKKTKTGVKARVKAKRGTDVSEIQEESAHDPHESREPIPADAEAFWGGASLEDDFPGEVNIPSLHGALLKRLGGFPFWRGEESFADAMEEIYRGASQAGIDVFLGERSSERER